MSEVMDIKDYIPARIAALRARQQELVKENESITQRIDELLRMTQPAEPEKPVRKPRKVSG